jgi:hypothetical protein
VAPAQAVGPAPVTRSLSRFAVFVVLVPACAASERPRGSGTTSAAGSPGMAGAPMNAGSTGTSAGRANGGNAGAANEAGRSESGAAGKLGTSGTAGAAGAAMSGNGGMSVAGSGSHGGTGTGGAAGAGGAAHAGAGEQAGSGPTVGTPHNPVLPGYNADPQVALFDGKFYIYPTTDGFANWGSTSFRAFSSNDLVQWKDEGVLLELGKDVSWATARAWAPGIARKNGVFYYYFSADVQIGVATASTPTGPFQDALGKPLIETAEFGGQSIDPYAFIDDDGRAYLYFGSTSAGGHVVELGEDMVSLRGTPQQIVISGFKEGSVAFKRNGIYYFMWSEDDTRSENYNVAYGTGSSPFGPFTKAAVNPILEKNTALGILGTGHASVLALPNGDYYIVYHRFAIPDGDGTHREVCIDRLYFNPDGSIVPVVPTQ